MDRLTVRQQDILRKYLGVMKAEERRLIFGPYSKTFFRNAKTIFYEVNVGFHAKSEGKDQQIVYVDSYQADKLMNVLTQLTNQSSDEITDGYFTHKSTANRDISLINWAPTRERKKKAKKKDS